MKKILYVEDDATLAFLTVDSLEENYEVVHCADGETALEMFCSQSFDLCLLDIMLSKLDGFELAKEIRKRDQQIPLLFLSAKTLKEDRIKGLKIGADDYLVKPFSMEELHLKINVFLKRSAKEVPQNKDFKVGNFIFKPKNYSLHINDKTFTLTERESHLLQLFVEQPNVVIKREQILHALWGNEDYFSGRSLDVFISRLRKILKEDPNLKIENSPRIGFKLVL